MRVLAVSITRLPALRYAGNSSWGNSEKLINVTKTCLVNNPTNEGNGHQQQCLGNCWNIESRAAIGFSPSSLGNKHYYHPLLCYLSCNIGIMRETMHLR